MRQMLAQSLFAAIVGLAPWVARGATAESGDVIAVQGMTLTVPSGWHLRQDAKDEGTIILGFENGTKYLSLYVKEATDLDMHNIFVTNGAQIVHDVTTVPHNGYNWKVLETTKRLNNRTNYVASFLTTKEGYSYFGFARDTSSVAALADVEAFLQELR